jgi:hypothetical protein
MRRSNPGATNEILFVAPGLLRLARNDESGGNEYLTYIAWGSFAK